MIVKHLSQGRNNVTRAQGSRDQGRRKNDAFALSAALSIEQGKAVLPDFSDVRLIEIL